MADPAVDAAAKRLQSFVDGEFASSPNAYWPVIKDIARVVLYLYARRRTSTLLADLQAEQALQERIAGIPAKQVKLHGTSVPLREKEE